MGKHRNQKEAPKEKKILFHAWKAATVLWLCSIGKSPFCQQELLISYIPSQELNYCIKYWQPWRESERPCDIVAIWPRRDKMTITNQNHLKEEKPRQKPEAMWVAPPVAGHTHSSPNHLPWEKRKLCLWAKCRKRKPRGLWLGTRAAPPAWRHCWNSWCNIAEDNSLSPHIPKKPSDHAW